jgi:hypothetical protein
MGKTTQEFPVFLLITLWLQVNVFMPSMQISFLPWIYDEQVVEHARYLPYTVVKICQL